MAISDEKTRVQISLGNDLLAALDDYCAKTGMSRSAYIAFVVSQNIYGTERIYSSVTDALNSALEKAEK